MKKLSVQLRTRNNLLDLLARGESPAWVIAEGKEEQLTHVRIVNWDGTQMIEGAFVMDKSTRNGKRLTVAFSDAHIVNCHVDFTSRNSVRYPDKDEEPAEYIEE